MRKEDFSYELKTKRSGKLRRGEEAAANCSLIVDKEDDTC
jgi:hypothetical protein